MSPFCIRGLHLKELVHGYFCLKWSITTRKPSCLSDYGCRIAGGCYVLKSLQQKKLYHYVDCCGENRQSFREPFTPVPSFFQTLTASEQPVSSCQNKTELRSSHTLAWQHTFSGILLFVKFSFDLAQVCHNGVDSWFILAPWVIKQHTKTVLMFSIYFSGHTTFFPCRSEPIIFIMYIVHLYVHFNGERGYYKCI